VDNVQQWFVDFTDDNGHGFTYIFYFAGVPTKEDVRKIATKDDTIPEAWIPYMREPYTRV
jgi:hypothetical protein